MRVNPLTDLLKPPADDRAELAMALWESLTDVERDGVFELTDEQRPLDSCHARLGGAVEVRVEDRDAKPSGAQRLREMQR